MENQIIDNSEKKDSKFEYIDKWGKYCDHCGSFYISDSINSDYDTDEYESDEDSEERKRVPLSYRLKQRRIERLH